MSELVGQTLGHYRIVEKIGAGGMGEVYRAHDEKLDRDVAIKVLLSLVEQDASLVARFEREAKAVAQLAHPNILEIWDFGSEDGVTFAVTELLDGQNLRQCVPASGLPWQKVVEIGAAIADGLAAAHGKGIVHRDLKPENIFITSDGRVKVLDFGLAKVLEAVNPDAETGTFTPADTKAGTVLGTLGYMAPEQLKAGPANPRSDVFALGCVLYEMVSGRRAFGGATAAETMAATLKEDPQRLSSTGATLPVELERSIHRCLEKSPEARFQSAADLAYSLGTIGTSAAVAMAAPTGEGHPAGRWMRPFWVAATLITTLVALGVVLGPVIRDRVQPPNQRPLRIAVLPFENLGSADDSYLVDGITDEVRGKMTRIGELQVIARASSDQYRGKSKALDQIAAELDVQYLVMGRVRSQKTPEGPIRIRVSPELVEVRRDGSAVVAWQDAIDASVSDVFQVQTDIAVRVAEALEVTFGANERSRVAEAPTDNLAAYDAFLRAQALRREESAGLTLRLAQRSAEIYQRAVALDPEFALAWAELSNMESDAFYLGDKTPERAEASRQAAERALALDSSLPASRVAMSYYWRRVVGDLDRAVEQSRIGLETAPNDAGLLVSLSQALLRLEGRWEESLENLDRAALIDPFSPGVDFLRGFCLIGLGRLEEARVVCDRALARIPASRDMIWCKTAVYLAQGDLEGARAFLKTAAEGTDATDLIVTVAVVYDMYWVLDDEWQQLLLRLGPEPFGGDPINRNLAFAHTLHLRGEDARIRAFAEEARTALAAALASLPDSPSLNVAMGVSLAYLGRRDEALAYGRRGVELGPISKDALDGPYYQLSLVRIHLLLDEHEPALDLLEPLLKVPFYLSPGWLRVDPMFDPLREHPRFQALIEKHESEE